MAKFCRRETWSPVQNGIRESVQSGSSDDGGQSQTLRLQNSIDAWDVLDFARSAIFWTTNSTSVEPARRRFLLIPP